MQKSFLTHRPGRLPYRTGLALQEEILERGLPDGHDLLILLSHPPTITLGRGAGQQNLLSSVQQLQAAAIEVFPVARGGDVTYHGPGQIVGYPLVDLTRRGKDLHRYLRDLEEVLIRTLAEWRIDADRHPENTGVWVDGRKIASIGVGVRRWISWHGFALNIDADPGGFSHIVPCGLNGVEMTSLQELLGSTPLRNQVEEALIANFSAVFAMHHAGDYDA